MKRNSQAPSTFTALVTLTLAIILILTAADQSSAGVRSLIAEAKEFYTANRSKIGEFSCCGKYTGGYPGNVNCDPEGKRNLEDITCLIGTIYHVLPPGNCITCCPENANIDADPNGKFNLTDITMLIDHIYISRAELPPCL